MTEELATYLDRRRFAFGALALTGAVSISSAGGAGAWAKAPADDPGAIPQRIRELYRSSISIDCLASPDTFNVNYPPREDHLSSEQLENARSSGLTAVNLSVGGDSPERKREAISKIKADIARNSETLMLVRNQADIAAAKAAGKLGIILGFQGIEWMQEDLTLIDEFADANVLIMQLTYNQESAIGSGALSTDAQPGLEPAGREAMKRIAAQKSIVDLAHSHPQTALDAARESPRPIILSHTGCSAVYEHPRNQPDEVFTEVANGGGVLGIYIMPFLGIDTLGPSRALVTRHIVHALNVAGEDHVGIGSDASITPVLYDDGYRAELKKFIAQRVKDGKAAPLEDSGLPFSTPGLNTPRRLEVMAWDLSRAGIKDAVIAKVLGGNFQRVFGETWA